MTTPAGNVPPPSGLPESTLATDYAAAQARGRSGFGSALLIFSRWSDDPHVSEQEQQQLLPLLNQLAGTVIYSQEHLLLPAYEVQPGDTLDRVAQHYRVPWQLLAKINGVADPNQLQPGSKLKVIQGPFDASRQHAHASSDYDAGRPFRRTISHWHRRRSISARRGVRR